MPQLTAQEIVDRSDELARLEIDREEIKGAWKEQASNHNSRMKRLDQRIMQLAREVQSGFAEDVQTTIEDVDVPVLVGSGPDSPISLEESSENAVRDTIPGDSVFQEDEEADDEQP